MARYNSSLNGSRTAVYDLYSDYREEIEERSNSAHIMLRMPASIANKTIEEWIDSNQIPQSFDSSKVHVSNSMEPIPDNA